jgi:uncharacterized RDD family membrane protein YckC
MRARFEERGRLHFGKRGGIVQALADEPSTRIKILILSEGKMEKVGFVTRLIAYLIDIVILVVINVVLTFALGMVLGDSGAAIASLLSLVIVFGYVLYFWSTSGQTPGKSVMKIKIVSTDGSAMTMGKAVMRLIGYVVSGLIFYLGFIWILFDANKQGWHDKIAGTYVVKA